MNSSMSHAVKALIYKDDRRILLQQRDYTPGIMFQGYWTFFGGQVESGENLKDALCRELEEELGCLPGNIGEELFHWEWQGEQQLTHNHCLPVCFEVKEEALVLNEGLAMRWFLWEELNERLPLVPGVCENLYKIKSFLDKTLSGR
ncbi:NUDIX hydrolase [Leptospira santarosai]|nr:NUDIX domain-containing protein [Leptospira santarosai]MDI7182309.1 NUDIX domain-containing protein [Leptospira santarosai]MDI7198220.1 NUDIX domain-containing protein [Leptospira santarosai]MDI7205150.1 NUDIX domain-containing protein [Leptospira santarosai]MDI7225216.1 NUDIX domain-containing protein [Leptospira santarosai]MDI7236833.1 NUDIX domain-containing protein [Leptospira santarosai]